MKAKRRLRPTNWAALEGFARALRHFGETGDPSKFRSALIPVRNIADCLSAIADGEDAREVFRQTNDGRPGRQSQGVENTTRAIAYWLERIRRPEDVDGAVAAAQARFPQLPKPSRASILRNARRHREHFFRTLPHFVDNNGQPLNLDPKPLREFLARTSKRGRY
jgi:hypothetical protein